MIAALRREAFSEELELRKACREVALATAVEASWSYSSSAFSPGSTTATETSEVWDSAQSQCSSPDRSGLAYERRSGTHIDLRWCRVRHPSAQLTRGVLVSASL